MMPRSAAKFAQALCAAQRTRLCALDRTTLAAGHTALRRYSGDHGDNGMPARLRAPFPILGLFRFVPEKQACVVERFGRFSRLLSAGLNITIPIVCALAVRSAALSVLAHAYAKQAHKVAWLSRCKGACHTGVRHLQVESVAYTHSLKELTLLVNTQQAITKDNVTIHINGVLYVRVVDAFKASYGVDEPLYAVMQLAQARSCCRYVTLHAAHIAHGPRHSKLTHERPADIDALGARQDDAGQYVRGARRPQR